MSVYKTCTIMSLWETLVAYGLSCR